MIALIYLGLGIACLGMWNLVIDEEGTRTYIFVHLGEVDMAVVYLFGPLLYVMVSELLNPGNTERRKYIIHFVPALLVLLLMIRFYILPEEIKAQKPMSVTRSDSRFWLEDILLLLPLVSFLLYIMVAIKKLIPVWRVKQEDPQKRRLLRIIVLMLNMFICNSIAMTIYSYFYYDYNVLRVGYCIIGVTVIIEYLMGYRGPNFSQILFHSVSSEGKSPETGSSAPDRAELGRRLKELMDLERVYSSPDLTLEELAAELKITRTQLSEFLNQSLGKNFKNYVNEYRVREAQSLLQKDPDASITSIAFAVGFSSTSTFNRAFTGLAGTSPREYRKNKMVV